MTFKRFAHLTSAGFFALVFSTASPEAVPGIDVPAVPAALQVPAGHSVFFKGHAIGTQNFMCVQTTAGFTWRFIGPQATLFLTFKGDVSQQLSTHFLSPNPAENAVARPTWQHSFDTSQVWGRVLASSSDPAYVEPGAIPWLLLEVAGAQLGPTGGGALARATYIHRLSTSGGLTPTTGCSQTGDIGNLALVPYEADYFFYQPTRP